MRTASRRRTPRGARAALTAVLLLASCSFLDPGRHDDVQSELDRRRRQWNAQRIDSYTLVLTRDCYCPPPSDVRLTVADGRVVERRFVETGEALSGEEARWWPAVDGLFDVLQDAVDRDAHSIRVEYHPRLGYPASLFIDYQRNVADEELGFRVRALERR